VDLKVDFSQGIDQVFAITEITEIGHNKKDHSDSLP